MAYNRKEDRLSTFQDNFKRALLNSGKSLRDVHEDTGISLATLYRYLTVGGNPSIYTIELLSESLGVSRYILVG